MRLRLNTLSILFTIFALLMSVTFTFASVSVSDAKKLRRISLLLAGKDFKDEIATQILDIPDEKIDSEIDSLKKWDSIINSYLQSHEFAEKMRWRILELLRLKTDLNFTPLGVEKRTESNIYTGEKRFSAVDQLILKMIIENKSWDDLLLEKSYQFEIRNSDLADDNSDSDFNFFRSLYDVQIFNQIPQKHILGHQQLVKVSPENENQKIASSGVITTQRFISRYPTTKVNKNRKRAATLFRVFLCDDMKPVVLPSVSEDETLIQLASGVFTQKENEHSKLQTEEQKHGSDPQCQGCHYKLDPMGKLFRNIGKTLNSTPAPGALVYRRKNNELVEIPLRGIGDLGKALIQLPEYQQCQVRHFWDWFIGKDIPLSEALLSELTTEFNRLERKPKDFIKVLLHRPEFSQDDSSINNSNLVTLQSVSPLLERCYGCHLGMNLIPSFTQLPIGGSLQSHQYWINKISDKLDLEHQGIRAEMPPVNAGWSLNSDDIKLLNTWIQEGTPNENNEPLLTPKKVISEVTMPLLQPTFLNTYHRYLERYDFEQILSQLFYGQATSEPSVCPYTDSQNKELELGFANPATGEPLSATPGFGSVNRYISCIKNSVKKFTYFMSEDLRNQFSEKKTLDPLPEFLRNSIQVNEASQYWNHMTISHKTAWVDYMIQKVIGTLRLTSIERLKLRDKLLHTLKVREESLGQPMDFKEALSTVLVHLLSSKYFLTF